MDERTELLKAVCALLVWREGGLTDEELTSGCDEWSERNPELAKEAGKVFDTEEAGLLKEDGDG